MSYSDDSDIVLSDASDGSDYQPEKPLKSKNAGGGAKTSPKKAAAPKKPAKESAKATTGDKENGGGGGASSAMNKSATQEDIDKVFSSIDVKKKGGKPTIEQIYQKKTQLEHILLRPDTYIGSVEKHQTTMWVYDIPEGDGEGRMVQREIEYVPGLYKIFDEILVNAADNKQRDPSMTTIKITIDPEKNEISVWNNGKGIPVVEHKEYKVYVPELIFGTLLTSSNYNDDQQKVTGGRNGYGAKLCNIFSTKFTVETSCRENKKAFRQTWTANMSKPKKEAKIAASDKDDFTKITFTPDLAKFGMERLDRDIVALLQRRAFDVAGSTKGVRVFLNGRRLPVNGFKAYVEQYLKEKRDDRGEPLKVVYEDVSDRWQVAVAVSDKGFQQVSFVNSIATTKGGRHVDYVADALTAKLVEKVKKDLKKGNMVVKPFQIKQHMWIFVNALIVNPTFDSQTKENMTTVTKNFGSKCDLSEKFVTAAGKCGITDAVLNWVRFKQQEQLEKKSGKKTSKLKVAKLEDANDAGTRNSANCTLILTEGDSAKTLAVSGLGVVGRDTYGVFPLKGKCLNTREASHKQIMENAEINAIIKILGLSYKKKYETEEEVKSLRYGKLMVMADQDQDGSHIKGLIINFIHHSWPALVRRAFIEEFITPIVKATKGKEEISFFSIPEFLNWKKATPNWQNYKVKYYKGLGTSTAKEAKDYFSDMRRHRIPFRYAGKDDDAAIELAFSKKLIEERKDWLTAWMSERRTRREAGEDEAHLYTADTRSVSYADFVNKELVLFSNMDNERSIPSLVDGFKPGQRKVLFTCFKRNDRKEVKVAQLAGSVAEKSEYHHGEASLMGTIVNLAQNFVGSNNLNFLLPIGQFGTRLQGGKDSASPRYIFTRLNPVTRAVFCPEDDDVLKYLFEDSSKIEPEWYCPIIPTILVNGASGIGTGWSTSVPNYNPRDIVANIRRLLDGKEAEPMQPWYKGFRGEIQQLDAGRFVCHGEVALLDDHNLEITELPIKTWTEAYKTSVLDVLMGGDAEKKAPQLIQEYRDNTTDTTVKFKLRLSDEQMRKADQAGMHKQLKLSSVINTSSMVLFDADGVLRRYDSVLDILTDFFTVRKLKYMDRKNHLEGSLQAEASRLANQARFIKEKIEGTIVIENKKKAAIVEELVRKGYDADPLKAWKAEEKRRDLAAGGDVARDEDEKEEEKEADKGDKDADPKLAAALKDYDYLLSMHLIKLSKEEAEKLMKQRDDKQRELRELQAKDWKDLWRADLVKFEAALEEQEEKERKEAREAGTKAAKGAATGKGRGGKTTAAKDTEPTVGAERIEPVIDAATKDKYAKLEAAKGRPKGEGRGRKKGLERLEQQLEEEDDLYHRVLKKSPKAAEILRSPKKPTLTGAMDKFLGKAKKEAAEKRKPEAKKPAKPAKRKRKNSWSGTDSEDSDVEPSDGGMTSEEEEILELSDDSASPPPAKPSKSRARKAAPESDDEGDSDSPPPPKESKPKAKPAAALDLGDEEDSDSPPPAKEAKTTAKEKDVYEMDEDSDSPAPVAEKAKAKAKAKAPAKAKAAPAKKRAAIESDSDDDDEVSEPPSGKSSSLSKASSSEGGPGAKASKKASSESPPPRSRPGRARAVVNYGDMDETEEGDASDDDDDDDFAVSD